MKFVVSILAIALLGTFVYWSVMAMSPRRKKAKGIQKKAIYVTAAVVVVLLGILAYAMAWFATAPDTQCMTVHTSSSMPPVHLKTANDYFLQGNYDYDTGDCAKAIADYAKAIKLNPGYAQAYNNRAYTYMRIQDYRQALPDLNHALALNPNYIQSLMNRGDIHNYYYQIDRQLAIADYEKVIALGGTHSTSVCGHLFLAEHKGWTMGTLIDLPSVMLSACN